MQTDGRTDRHDEANFSTASTTLCFVSRTFIVFRTLHSHYRKQNLGSGLIILGSGSRLWAYNFGQWNLGSGLIIFGQWNLGSGLIILGSGISTVRQSCQPLLVVSLGVVLCHDCLEVSHVRETFYSTAKFMTYAKPRDSVVHDLCVPVMMKHFELSRNNNCLFCDVLCIVCLYMYTEQLPPGGYPIAVK